MKIVAAFLLCCLCSAQEIKRPTAGVDAGALSALSCFGTNQASSAMPLSFDSAGQATSSQQIEQGALGSSNTIYKTRLFKAWAAASGAYTSLTLNINASTFGNGGDLPAAAKLSYSLNGGSTWTLLFNDFGVAIPKQTYSIVLNPTQDLDQLRVGLCVQAHGQGSGTLEPGDDVITVWDIWTLGQTTPQSGGSGSGSTGRHNAVIVN